MNETVIPGQSPWYRRLRLKTRFMLLFYLLTIPSMGVIGFYGYTSASEAYRVGAAKMVEGDVYQIGMKISGFLELTHNDLNFFSKHTSLLRQMYWLDMHDTKKHDEWNAATLDTWKDFLRSYDYLHKARFVGMDGRERIVVRRDPVTHKVDHLPEPELQDHKLEPYFQNALQLTESNYAVSSVDLSREHGQIEKPTVPIVTLSHLVVGDNQVNYGVVILDLFADAFFQYIRDTDKRMEAVELYLLDAQGNYLYHQDKTKMLNHILGHGNNFRYYYPGVMEALEQKTKGTLFSSGQIFGFERIFPRPADQQQYWILVGSIPESAVLGPLKNFKEIFIGLVLMTLALVFVVSHYYVRSLMRPLHFVTRQLQLLSTGRIEPDSFSYLYQDEIRQMLDSTERLLANMSALATQANTIARGDLSRDVVLLSPEDQLGMALNHMTLMLRQGADENRRRNWIRDSIGRLNQELTGDLTPQELVERALTIVGSTLEAGRGVFYLYDAETQVLDLLGTYMFTRRRHLGNRVQLGEGAVGQVARERKPFTLVLPEEGDNALIATGTTMVPAQHTTVYPLLREGALLGVMELNGFIPMNPERQEFMEGAVNVVASLLFMAMQRQRIKVLFERAEEARELALNQATELAKANVNLEEQQQRLQQQTEELQQSNAQMEEQQQQLQQQSEELQQTNAQMEEQQGQLRQQSEELQAKNDALLSSQKELDQRARMLEESNRYKSEFLANMSHELRTPLNSIIVLSKMLSANEHHDLDEESIKQARVIHDAGNELLRLINDILDLSKIEAGHVEVQWEQFATSELLSEFQDLFTAGAREKGLVFSVEDQYRSELVSDRHKLSQVIRNLLSNAFKFTIRGQVSVTVRPDEHHRDILLFQVADTGIGIPADKHKLIFEEFQQVDGTISRQFGGTGLGLSISRRLIGLLGGEITLESIEGQGSTFTIHLPLKTESTPKVAAPQPDVTTKAPPIQKVALADDRAKLVAGDRPILVIDDDTTFCETVILINHRLGFQTVAAVTGREGLELARTLHPSGIVLDLGLPDMNGMEVLNQLKATRELNAVPVYIITGKEGRIPWQEEGAFGFLKKPVEADSLTRVMAQLAPKGTANARILVVSASDLPQGQDLTELERGKGVQVVRVRDYDTAVAAVRNQGDAPFAVVICDYHLPGGIVCTDLFRSLRAMHPDLRCIVLNDESLSEEKLLAVRSFTDSIIQQVPQANSRLLADVERFLREVRQDSRNDPEIVQDPLNGLAGRTILIVDDDARNLYVITAALERHGARVLQAMNGKKALQVLEKERIDLVVTDIMMPEMSGYQTIEAIRADNKLKDIPIIALTAKAMKSDREKCLAVGADDYIAKPVDYDVLINLVKAWSAGRR
ncbi:MAG: response regulator [Magnetococcales bacterium]|nr:response regulator [Magnetococcales bacterium]